jgi:hypothetical protein
MHLDRAARRSGFVPEYIRPLFSCCLKFVQEPFAASIVRRSKTGKPIDQNSICGRIAA